MMEKKQFIYPEILVHNMRRSGVFTDNVSPSQKLNPYDSGNPDDLAPTRGGFGSPTMEDNSNWNDLSGFESNGSGW